MPSAKPPSAFQRNWQAMTPGIDEFRATDAEIIRRVEEQLRAIDEQAMAAATVGKEAA
jgi:hypothetical protein